MAQEFSDYQEPDEEELRKMLDRESNSNTITILTNDNQIQVDASLFGDDIDIPDDEVKNGEQ